MVIQEQPQLEAQLEVLVDLREHLVSGEIQVIVVIPIRLEEVGGGWYGGGGSGGEGPGGGGGSGYVYTSSTASQYPSGCLLNSSYYLTNASTTGNNRSGNGYARITLVE